MVHAPQRPDPGVRVRVFGRQPARACLGLLAAACSEQKKADVPADSGKTRITFATDWRAQAEQGGFYQALATGEYEKRAGDGPSTISAG